MRVVESAYHEERVKARLLVQKLTALVEAHERRTRETRMWGDVGDLERVLGAVQVAVDVLEVEVGVTEETHEHQNHSKVR